MSSRRASACSRVSSPSEFRERQIEVHYHRELVAVDTFFVGALKG